MSLIQCEGIVRAIEMVGNVEVHNWISLSNRSKDFLVSMFEAYSNMELNVTYMCFERSMTGKRCENCHYLCISDVSDIPLNYAIEISFCYEDGVKVNLFFKRVYERKSLVWRCWMSKISYGTVRVFKQKFFHKLIKFIKERSNELFIRSMKKCSTLDVGFKMIIKNTEIVCTCGYRP